LIELTPKAPWFYLYHSSTFFRLFRPWEYSFLTHNFLGVYMDRLVLIKLSSEEISTEYGWSTKIVGVLRKILTWGGQALALFFVPPKLIKRESLEVPPDSIETALVNNSWSMSEGGYSERAYTQQRISGWIG
jgi:hypothetical protein